MRVFVAPAIWLAFVLIKTTTGQSYITDFITPPLRAIPSFTDLLAFPDYALGHMMDSVGGLAQRGGGLASTFLSTAGRGIKEMSQVPAQFAQVPLNMLPMITRPMDAFLNSLIRLPSSMANGAAGYADGAANTIPPAVDLGSSVLSDGYPVATKSGLGGYGGIPQAPRQLPQWTYQSMPLSPYGQPNQVMGSNGLTIPMQRMINIDQDERPDNVHIYDGDHDLQPPYEYRFTGVDGNGVNTNGFVHGHHPSQGQQHHIPDLNSLLQLLRHPPMMQPLQPAFRGPYHHNGSPNPPLEGNPDFWTQLVMEALKGDGEHKAQAGNDATHYSGPATTTTEHER